MGQGIAVFKTLGNIENGIKITLNYQKDGS